MPLQQVREALIAWRVVAAMTDESPRPFVDSSRMTVRGIAIAVFDARHPVVRTRNVFSAANRRGPQMLHLR